MKLLPVVMVAAACAAAMTASCSACGDSASCKTDEDCPSNAYCNTSLSVCIVRADDAGAELPDGSVDGGEDAGPVWVGGPARVCNPEGWCWENPLPQGEPLHDVFWQGSTAFAVGDISTVLLKSGAGEWAGRFGGAGRESLVRVSGGLLAGQTVWTLSSSMRLFRVTGSGELGALDAGLPGTNTPALAGDFGMAWVGSDSHLFQVNADGALSQFQTPNGQVIGTIARAAGRTWVAGDQFIGTLQGATVVAADCGEACYNSPCLFLDSWVDETNAIWFTGEGLGCTVKIPAGTTAAVLVDAPDSAEQAFYSVSGSSSHDVWLVSGAQIDRWDGGSWSASTDDPVVGGVLAFNSRDAGVSVSYDGTIYGWNGSVWSEQNRRFTLDNLVDVSLSTDGTAVVVSKSGVWSRVDGKWMPIAGAFSTELRTVFQSSQDDIWVGGAAGGLQHWNGSAWSDVPLGISGDIVRIRGSSSSDVWLLATGPEVWRWNGNEWKSVDFTGFTGAPLDLDVDEAGKVAVLVGSALRLWDGAWHDQYSIGQATGVLVHGDQVLLYGPNGISSWRPTESLPVSLLQGSTGPIKDALRLDSDNVAFLGLGTSYLWDGQQVVPWAFADVNACAGNHGAFFAVGQGGTVLSRILPP